MNATFLIFFGLFFLIYGAASYYVGLRGKQAFRLWSAFPGDRFYWLLYVLLSTSYFIGRFGARLLPEQIGWIFTLAGSYWLAALFYLTLACASIDAFRLIDRYCPKVPTWLRTGKWIGPLVVGLVGCILFYGAWNARNPVWKTYEISIDKEAGDLESLRVVLLTDIHLGKIIDASRLKEMVDAVNERSPDLILLAGDIVDEDVIALASQDMPNILRGFKAKFGVFAALGNHEYIGRETAAAVELIRSGRIVVLRDEYFSINGQFIVAGRDDWDSVRFRNTPRKTAQEVLQGANPKLPVLMMDHQPRKPDEARDAGVDLLVSGHTHRGQLFPGRLITGFMYENDWGYLQKGPLHWIVSSGYGTWGPPVRIGARPEMVEIIVRFRSKS